MRTDELMEKNQMKLAKSIAVVAVCALSYGALSGCTPVSKIRRTLALSDIHIQAGVAEPRARRDCFGAMDRICQQAPTIGAW